MAGMICVWHGNPSTKRVLVRFNEGRRWHYRDNWIFSRRCIMTPMFRWRKGYREAEIGLGNYYLEVGW